MKQFVLLIAIISLGAIGFSCSQDPVDPVVETPAASEPAAELTIESVTDARIALAEGNRLLDENQTEKAIEFLEHAITLDPDLADAHFQLGIAYDLLELQYEREGVLVETSETNAKGEKKKSRSEKAFERAVKAYEKWLDTNPKDDVAHYNLGRTYSKLMKDEEAEKAFEEAVKIKPDDTEYQTELGAIRVKLARYHEAIEPLKKAIELDPENVRAEELLEDAQAGRQRLDYNNPKQDTNKQAANKQPTPRTDEPDKPSNTNSAPVPLNANTRPRTEPSRRPTPQANRPQ